MNALAKDCIIFTGYRQKGGTGYGERTVKRKRWLAHRYSYFENKGPIPTGKLVCHACDNMGCINPDHLHLGDPKSNALEAKERGRTKNGNSVKVACSKCGGPFSKSGAHRYCRKCKNDWQRGKRAAMASAQGEGK